MASPAIEAGEGDAHRRYSLSEEQVLSANLHQLLQEVHEGSWRARKLEPALLRELHARIFRGVRDFAGRTRGPGFGSSHLVFGPNRSIERHEVDSQLAEAHQRAERSLTSLDENYESEDYETSAVHTAVWLHAQIVRIHPFEDGNGRASRAMLNWFLVRCGLRPVAVEAVKNDYNDSLNQYFAKGDITPLVDLILECMVHGEDDLDFAE